LDRHSLVVRHMFVAIELDQEIGEILAALRREEAS
jgi:hypothetical protein